MIKVITKNIRMKSVCLAAAAILWFYVSASQNAVFKLPGTINIKASNVAENLIPRYDEKEVSVKIMGKSSDWQKISSGAFTASIDLAGLSAGTHQVSVNVYSNLAGISIVDTIPSSLIVTLEPIVAKDVGIGKKILGSPADGYVVSDVSFQTERVTIKGAKSAIDNTDEATALISLNGEKDAFEGEFPLFVYDHLGKAVEGVEILPNISKGRVEFERGSNIKSVGVRANLIGVPKSNHYLSDIKINPNVVEISGPKSIIDGIGYLETLPVDINGISSKIEKEVALKIPEGIKLADINNYKVKLAISLSTNEISREVTTTSITAKNHDEVNIQAYLPTEVTAVISGAPEKIYQIRPNDVLITLDFAGKKPINDEVSFTLQENNFSLPEGVLLKEIKTRTVVARVVDR